jgi:hypothetical protein
MKPETKKGMFANGKSSNPGVINLLESTKTNSKLVLSHTTVKLNSRSKGVFISIDLREKAHDGITRKGLEGSMET